MKASTLISTLAFAASAVAQVQSIIDVMNGVNTKAGALDTAIKSYTGGNPSAVLNAAQALNSAVTSGITTVNAAQMISTADALQIVPVVQTLTTTVNSTVTDLIAKKPMIVAAGEGATTGNQLSQQLTGAKDLSTAISSKVPPELAPVAMQQSAGITNAIQSGVTAFQNTGSASPAGPSSSAASPPQGSRTATSPASTGKSTSPAQFTGAAAQLKSIEGYSLFAMLAAVLAF